MASGISVKFSATDSGFTSTVNKVNSSMRGMDGNVRKVSGSVRASFATMAKAGAALAVGFGAIKVAMNAVRGTLDNFKEALDMGGELNDLSARTGETAGNLMILRRAFENTGAGAEKVGPAINKLQKAIIEAGEGNGAAVDAFAKLGVNLGTLKNAAPIDQLREVSEALKGVSNPSERSAIAMQIFGRAGGEMLPMLLSMADELKNAQAELGSLPGVMDRSAAAFDSISDKIAVMKGKLTEFAAGFLESAIPALNQFINAGSQLDAAGFGKEIGANLAAGFDAIASGDMWKSFKVHAEKAIHEILAGPANKLQAFFGAIKEGITSKIGDGYNFDKSFAKYEALGKQANNIIADSYERRLIGIAKDQADRLAESARKMDEEAASRAAMSGIMLKDVKTPKGFTTEIPDTLKRATGSMKKDFDFMAENGGKIADSFESAAQSMEKAKSYADNVWDAINAAKAQDKIDPGGRIKQRADEALAKGQFGVADRAGNRLDRKEQEQRIQDAFGGGGKLKKSLAEIAKAEGIDTKGKSSRDIRKALDDIIKKRQEEMKPGQGGKNRNDVGPGGEKKADPMQKLSDAVTAIQRLVEKIEPKLPTAALGA